VALRFEFAVLDEINDFVKRGVLGGFAKFEEVFKRVAHRGLMLVVCMLSHGGRPCISDEFIWRSVPLKLRAFHFGRLIHLVAGLLLGGALVVEF
jgi:hypothetical protein